MAKAKAIPSQNTQLRIVGPTNSFKAPRVQRVGQNTDIATNEINEIGNINLAGLTQDPPNITVTMSAFDAGIKIFSVLTGTDWTAYPAAGVNVSSLGEADTIIDIKDDTVADYVKSGHGRRLQVRDFSWSYSVDGEATEDYSLIGSQARWFKNDVIVDRFTTGTTSFTLTQTPIQLNDGNYLLSVILDGVYLTETTGVPAAEEYSVAGTTLTTGDTRSSQVIAVYHANPVGTNWTNLSDTSMPAAIKGKDIPIEIAANNIQRVQSVTINGNLNVTPVREMGNVDVVGYQKQVSTIDGSITVNDTDTELISLLTTGVLSGVGVSEYKLGVACPSSGVALKITMYDPCDTTSPRTVIKTVYLDQILATAENYQATARQNNTVTYNWRSITSNVVVYSGAM